MATSNSHVSNKINRHAN